MAAIRPKEPQPAPLQRLGGSPDLPGRGSQSAVNLGGGGSVASARAQSLAANATGRPPRRPSPPSLPLPCAVLLRRAGRCVRVSPGGGVGWGARKVAARPSSPPPPL